MKANRMALILELIKRHDIETQEEMTALLVKEGCGVTQGTVSRDIRDLGLVKRRAADGRFIYTKPPAAMPSILPGCVISLEQSLNILVIKTRSGMAMAAAAELDSRNLGVMGSIAGDDTIFCVVKSENSGKAVLSALRAELGFEAV